MILKVRIISPKEDLYAGEATSVSSVNSVGAFDILPGHAKFVTMVAKQPLVLRFADGEKKEFNFDMAIIHVKEDQVNIYTNPLSAGMNVN